MATQKTTKKAAKGAGYQLRRFHPRRPDQPLVVSRKRVVTRTDDSGETHEVAVFEPINIKPGGTCERATPKLLESLITSGFVRKLVITKMTAPKAIEAAAACATLGEVADWVEEESENKARERVLTVLRDRADELEKDEGK